MPEQLTLQQAERNRGAIQFNERAFATGAQIVQRAGDQFQRQSFGNRNGATKS